MTVFISGFAAPGPLPTFTNTPTNVTAIKGGKAILKCGIENLGTKTVSYTSTFRDIYNSPSVATTVVCRLLVFLGNAVAQW